MKFLICVIGLAIFAIFAASAELRGSAWLASALGMDAFGAILILAAFVFVASQWHFLRSFNPKNAGTLDYAANLLGVLACVAAFYGFTADTTRHLKQTYRESVRDLVSGGATAAARYDANFCLSTAAQTPETSVTCPLTHKAQQLLGEGPWSLTAERLRRFIDQEIATHDLNRQLKPAAPLDLEAFIPKPGPRVITEFNVLYSYLEEVAVATKIAEHYEGALYKLRWARFLGSENGRPLVLWVAFNAILMKLGVVLLRTRDRRRSDPGI